MKQTKTVRSATFKGSVLVMLSVTVILLVGVLVLKLDPYIPLMTATIPITLYGIHLGIPWKELMDNAYSSIAGCMEAAILILTIGMVVGAWIASGTVPVLIYYGIKILSPSLVLPLSFLLTALMSMLTGSSWTTVGTLGVAFAGIGTAMNINPALMVSTIVGGAFFGNAQSPMADIPVFSESISGVESYKGSKASVAANVPAFVISTVIYTIVGFKYTSGGNNVFASTQAVLDGLSNNFNLSIVTFVPAILMIICMVIKLPGIPTRFVAFFSALIIAIVFQGEGVNASFGYLISGYVGNSGIEAVDNILTRGGMNGMMGTIVIMIFSMWIAGIIGRTKIVDVILAKVSGLVKRIGLLVTTTTICTFIFNFIAADPFLSVSLPVKVFGKSFDKLGYDRGILCRCVNMAAYFAPMVPWGSGGIFVATTLGVPVVEFLPYYFVGFIAPIVNILLAFLGIAMPRTDAVPSSNTQLKVSNN